MACNHIPSGGERARCISVLAITSSGVPITSARRKVKRPKRTARLVIKVACASTLPMQSRLHKRPLLGKVDGHTLVLCTTFPLLGRAHLCVWEIHESSVVKSIQLKHFTLINPYPILNRTIDPGFHRTVAAYPPLLPLW